MVVILSRFAAFTSRHPVVKGMISYGTLWPTSCLIQQTISGKTLENYDWMSVFRFGLYGGLFTAPTLYAWIRVSTKLWPVTSLKTSIIKAVVEQLTYGPAALACFFFGMTLLQGKSVKDAKTEVQTKLLPTWKVGVCFWPIIQTVNFRYIPEHNRVPVVSACSLLWCCFLAYMHEMELKRAQEMKLTGQLLNN
ncbi:mpv17-like protein [Anthonomus grandis grandis]|uniref:mpv17-like protein n=1 Tax=Anthonomus grandis grandis TaxID=2921223 RepID=UPI0021650475|nr:mpv17-like protein [Anthonomus grandis grandis]